MAYVSMALYLCVDVGATKTSAAVADASGKVIARGSSGPSNYTLEGPDVFTAAVRASITSALQSLDPSHPVTSISQFAAASFGVSGLNSPADLVSVTTLLSALVGIPPGPRLLIANDTHLLAVPALAHEDVSTAVAVIAGTGSNTFSFRIVGGRIEQMGRIGGWGWMLGDEGSGFDVGREAVRQVLLEHDTASSVTGRASAAESQTGLASKILHFYGVSEPLEVLAVVHQPEAPPGTDPTSVSALSAPRRLSSLAPLVFAAAFEDGDALALSVLRTCARRLAALVALLLGPVVASESVICFGGSLVGVAAYRQMVLDGLKEEGHVFRYAEYVDDLAGSGATALAAANLNSE